MKKLLDKFCKNKIAVVVVCLLLLAKFLGFIKNVFMAKYYGTSSISDAYQMALSIPTIVTGIVLYSYQAFTKGYFESEKIERADKYFSSFINFVLLILILITLLLFVFSNQIIYIFAPGFNVEQINYTRGLLFPMIIGTFFLAIANVLSEYLRCKKSYISSQISYLVINTIEILTIFIAFHTNYKWLSYGYLIANFTYFIILVILSYLKGLRYKLILSKIDINLFIKILLPVFLSSIITDVNTMVDKIFASKFGEGIVSTLSYATNIKTVFLIVAAGYLTVLYPNISKLVVEKKYVHFNEKIKNGFKTMIFIYIPLTVIIFLFSSSIIRIVYYRGSFDNEALLNTSSCMIMYGIGIAGICLRDLYIKALYCLNKGKIVTFVSFVSVLLNILLNVILSNKFGYVGLPLATSLSVWLVVPLLFVYYKNYYKKNISERSF